MGLTEDLNRLGLGDRFLDLLVQRLPGVAQALADREARLVAARRRLDAATVDRLVAAAADLARTTPASFDAILDGLISRAIEQREGGTP